MLISRIHDFDPMEEGKNDLAREADLAESGERFQFGHICFIRVRKVRLCVHTGYFLNHQTNLTVVT